MRFTLLIAALIASQMAVAQSYKWVDANGRTHYTDQPPGAGKPATALKTAPPAATAAPPAVQPSLAEQEQAFRKRRQDAEDKSAKTAKEQQAAKERANQCQNARRNLVSLESGARVTRRNEQGEREFLNEEQLETDRSQARRFIQENCA